jgi:Pregnancy-associated plasma protein-A/Secretion system C-terminal sorting domain
LSNAIEGNYRVAPGTITDINGEAVLMIPVVVHVVHRNDAENISDAVIRGQIDIMNNDFRRRNADRSNTPSTFASVSSDTKIQFYLACTDPQGNYTTGINRRRSTTHTNTVSGSSNRFVVEDRTVAFDSESGINSWDNTRYLNIYVADFYSKNAADNILGQGDFPHETYTLYNQAVNSTGSNVVSIVQIDYKSFGTGQTYLIAGADFGRTATHEIGHWLSLRHIWGDEDRDTNACSGSDFVDDTPNQAYSSPFTECYVHPKRDICMAPAIMFMNYMDYSPDNCMNIFTNGQKVRLRNTLNPATPPEVRRNLTYQQFYLRGTSQLGEYYNPTPTSQAVRFPNRTYVISGYTSGTTTWSVSNGINIVSQNNGSITVTGRSGFIEGTIEASINNGGPCGNIRVDAFTINVYNDPSASTSGTCTATYTDGQFLFNWYGENVYAHLCGTKKYVTTSAGTGGGFKPRHWLEATSYAQASCFEEDDPRTVGCTDTGGGTGGGTGTADLTESGTASDDGANNPVGEGEAQAFDNTSNTKWLVFSSTGNIAYDFANEDAYVVTRYTVASANDEPARDPKNWNLQGSNDGSNWTTVNSQNNQFFGNRFEVKPYDITNSTSYKRYRLNVTSNNGSGYLQIGEIQMFGGSGTPPPPPPPPTGGCSFTDGQFLLTYNGETIQAKFCGSILYARATWGAWKHPNWLIGAGMNPTTANCFATSNPGCGALGRMSALSEEEPVSEINVYPNPTTGKVKIVFSLSKDENVWFNLYDMQGKSLDLKDYEGKAGRNMMEYDLQNFPMGAYFINLQSSEKREILKVIKVD